MTWQEWVNGVLGIVVLVLPFLSLGADMMKWTLVVAGLVIAVLSFWSLMPKKKPAATS